MKKLLILFSLFVLFSLQIHAATRFVTLTGSGSFDGSSWANALPGTTLQYAIDVSNPGDEVWIAAGTYYPTVNTDRTFAFSMKNGVAIYGSFLGTESTLSQRDLSNGLTSILSGEIGAAGIADNSYKVVYNIDLDSAAILDGFIIEAANDDRTPTNAGDGLGGGIYNNGHNPGGFCHPTVRNCVFRGNTASWGAGAFNNGYNGGDARPTYINCVFANNHALIEAGGMDSYAVGGTASPTIINTIFYENTSATNVGAMYAWGGGGGNCQPVLINCAFVNNSALNGYGGAFIADNLDPGGGTSSGTCIVTLQNCIVRNNSATGAGPQFYVQGSNGAQVVATYSNIELAGQNFPLIISGAGTGNIDAAPSFLNSTSGAGADGNWMTADDGLTLQSASPCIDAGENSGIWQTDLLSNNRIFNGTVDMGPYEFSPPSSGIEDNTLSLDLSIFPNPAQDAITISVHDVEMVDLSLSLSDHKGRSVEIFVSKELGTGTFDYHMDLSQLEPGVYFLAMTSNKGELTRKIVKMD